MQDEATLLAAIRKAVHDAVTPVQNSGKKFFLPFILLFFYKRENGNTFGLNNKQELTGCFSIQDIGDILF